jgi:2-polyprenyl-3-methyl-5-hydroxy-6-metoxy-1,4-benzoquinol methylase
MSPLANAYRTTESMSEPETYYPLCAYVCDHCFLVQVAPFATPEEIFGDYAYFASITESWLRHAEEYASAIIRRLHLGRDSLVLEIASNDGYLLQFFRARGVPVLGVEPARNVAEAALERGIPTRIDFFSATLARRLVDEGIRADLVVANNVLAHVPMLHDFVSGVKHVLKPEGVFTMEFPHLLRLIEEGQFDTIYHEHFSYFSLLAVERVFAAAGLTLFDVEALPTHGGSLRVYGGHAGRVPSGEERLRAVREQELHAGLCRLDTYRQFGERVRTTKRRLLALLIGLKERRRSIVGYGAPAKGNTLLNYCAIRGDFLDYTVDLSPHKQGLFLPGTGVAILHPERIQQTRPDYVLILPWNLRDEIKQQVGYIREWGGRFILPIPEPRIEA